MEGRDDLASLTGDAEVMKLLFETPSGFAYFGFDGGFLNQEDAMKILWTKFVNKAIARTVVYPLEFMEFENKSDAINPISGVDERLARMIKKWWFGETLVVGKPEHKDIIERDLNIPCRYNDAVLEVMWGLKNVLHDVVPKEKLELSEEDRKHRSKGLQMFLQSLGYDIKQELVNRQIAETACYVYQCREVSKELLECLVLTDILEKEGIDTKGWNASKYATALLIMCTNETPYSPDQGFSGEDLCKIYGAKGKHDKELIKNNFMRVYKAAVKANKTHIRKLRELDALVKEAKERDGGVQELQEVLESEALVKEAKERDGVPELREVLEESERVTKKRKREV